MKLVPNILYLFFLQCIFFANFSIVSMQRVPASVPRLGRQAYRLRQAAHLQTPPAQSPNSANRISPLPSVMEPVPGALVPIGKSYQPTVNRKYLNYLNSTAVEDLVPEEEIPEKVTIAQNALILWHALQKKGLHSEFEKNNSEIPLIEMEKRLNRLKGYLDEKINLMQDLKNIRNGQDLYNFFTMIRDRYWNRGSYEIFTPHDLITILDYLKNSNKKSDVSSIFNNLLESLNKATTLNNGTADTGTFFGPDLKKELMQWFTKNPDYLIVFLQSLPDSIYSDNYSEDFILSLMDCIFPACEILINKNEYKMEILNFLESLTYLEPGNKHILQKISLKLKSQEYPHIVKELNDSHKIAPMKQLLFIRQEYEKELDQLKNMHEKNREKLDVHMQDPLNISSQHLQKLQTLHPEEIVKIKNSQSYHQIIDALDAAVSLTNRGYYTFFHGQQNGYALLNDIGTELLYQLAGLSKPADFNFLRFKQGDFKKTETPENGIHAALAEQRELMQSRNSGIGENLMALNLFAFAGYGVNGTYLPEYLESNYSVRPFHENLFNEVLTNLSIPEDIQNKAAPQFKKLLEKTDKAHPTGRLMLVAIPSNIVNERLYLFKWVGNFMESDRLPETVDKKVESLSLKSHQSFEDLNNFHCVMPLTPAGVLNPYNDIKILNFDSHVPKSISQGLADSKQKVVDTIIDELKKQGKLEDAQKRARDYFNFLQKVHIAEEKELTV